MTPQTTSPGPVPLVPSVAWPAVRGVTKSDRDDLLLFALFLASADLVVPDAPAHLRRWLAGREFGREVRSLDLPHRLN